MDVRLPSSKKVAGCCDACLDQVLSGAYRKSGTVLAKAGVSSIWSNITENVEQNYFSLFEPSSASLVF